jgi:outer membrane protein OmpA-like peptidoglycan-associated protein
MKNIFELSQDEKNSIRGLHESYKHKPGTKLIWEQDAITPQSSEIDVYYFGVPGPKTEKIYHDNNKIYYFDGENTVEIWSKDAVASYVFNASNKKLEILNPLMIAQENLQKLFKYYLVKSFGPLEYMWETQKLPTYYMVMFGDGGKMFLNAVAPIFVTKKQAKQDGLQRAKNDNDYYYANYKQSYVSLKGGNALITEIGFGKEISTTKPQPIPDIVIPKKFTFLLQDPFEFDSDVLTEKGKKDLEYQLERLPLFLNGAFKLGKLKDVLDSPITLLGYASSDADPSAMDGGNLPACSQYGKGKGPRKNYDLCLSQERANRVKEKIDGILNDVEIERGGKPEKINTIFPTAVANWVKAKGLGQDSSKSGFDWKEPHDPSQTALDRRVEMTPPIITISGESK